MVLQVAVQPVGEKEADTPAGNPEAANDTVTGFPERRVAVMPPFTELPRATESAEDALESEMADGVVPVAVTVRAIVVLAGAAAPDPETTTL